MGAKTGARGFHGWWLLVVLWIAYTIPIGFAFYGPMVLYPFMIEDMGWSRGEIMVGATAIMLLMGLGAPLTAWMIGRLGARLTMFIGGLITAVATLVLGLAGHNYLVYLAMCFVAGLGISLSSMVPIQTVIVSWFSARRALALGLVLGGGAIGGFLAPQIISTAVLEAGGDWRIGWFIIAVASIVAAVVAVLWVRNRPQDMGQHPDGLAPDEVRAAADGRRTTRTHRTATSWTVRGAARTPAFWLVIVAQMGCFFLWQVVITQGPLHLQDRGFDPAMAAFFYSLAIGLSIAGRFATAGLGDIIEPRFLFAFGALCVLVGGIVFWFVSPNAMWTAYLYPLLAGFGFGAAYVCIPAIIGNYWGAEAFAKINGVITPIAMILPHTAAPIAGFLYDLQGSYLTIMIISWIAVVVGLVAMLLCKPPRPKEGPEGTVSSV